MFKIPQTKAYIFFKFDGEESGQSACVSIWAD